MCRFLMILSFHFFLRVGMIGHTFNFIINGQTVFSKVAASLLLYCQLCVSVPFAL